MPDATFEDVPGTSSGGCGLTAESYGYKSTLAACWPCLDKGCLMQFYACNQDCACNAALVKALDCSNSSPGNVTGCFTGPFGSGDPTTMNLINCLAMTNAECGCTAGTSSTSGGSGSASSSGSCVLSGGGGSAGNGQCTHQASETCGGASYQVVCSCPRAECVCFGDTTSTIPFDGCPYCDQGPAMAGTSDSALFAACGFPQ